MPGCRLVTISTALVRTALVERIEGFAQPGRMAARAYDEINDFEAQLVERGYYVVCSGISLQEEPARFQAREQTPVQQQ